MGKKVVGRSFIFFEILFMPLLTPQPFQADVSDPTQKDPPISTNSEIPKDAMDIFYRSESQFLPEGKTFADLTETEQEELRCKYRFDCLKPGCYQGITATGKMVGTL